MGSVVPTRAGCDDCGSHNSVADHRRQCTRDKRFVRLTTMVPGTAQSDRCAFDAGNGLAEIERTTSVRASGIDQGAMARRALQQKVAAALVDDWACRLSIEPYQMHARTSPIEWMW
jgi:hypothetical protein